MMFLQLPFTPSLPSLGLYSFGDGWDIATFSESEATKKFDSTNPQTPSLFSVETHCCL